MRRWMIAIVFSVASFLLVLSGNSTYAKPDSNIKVEQVVAPATPLMTRWCYVIDNSHSMRDVFELANVAFLETIRARTDQMEFAMIAFNNQGMDRFRDWQWASETGFNDAYKWLKEDRHNGVMSYGASAIRAAIQQERDELTVILITDGGFTEVSRAGNNWDVIRRVFIEAQAWRTSMGLYPAQITCLGISNPNYTAGNKPSDKDCQAFLQEIGTTYGGGYFLVSGAL